MTPLGNVATEMNSDSDWRLRLLGVDAETVAENLFEGIERRFEANLGYRPSWRERRVRAIRSAGLGGYLGTLTLGTVLLTGLVVWVLTALVGELVGWRLVLLALYVSLGRELTPLVAEYQTELEVRGQAALGMPLRIARLEGRWKGFAPSLVAHDVSLGEADSSLR